MWDLGPHLGGGTPECMLGVHLHRHACEVTLQSPGNVSEHRATLISSRNGRKEEARRTEASSGRPLKTLVKACGRREAALEADSVSHRQLLPLSTQHPGGHSGRCQPLGGALGVLGGAARPPSAGVEAEP